MEHGNSNMLLYKQPPPTSHPQIILLAFHAFSLMALKTQFFHGN
uniref:Uncharacterized protein n=1 Tax=Rhizophora mucronata TaxID=61149 RepID=A0A2P2J5G4_RHIMU